MKNIIITIALLIFGTLVYAQNQHREQIDVQHYHINLDVSSLGNYSLSGHTEIIFSTVDETLETVAFDLYKYNIDSISFNGNWVQEFAYNDTIVSFSPIIPVQPGQNDTCTIYYHGFGSLEPGVGWGGVHFSNNMVFNMGVAIDAVPHGFGRAWFPCIDNFTDRATYDFEIITQDDHRAVATGLLQDVTNYGTDELKWHWSFSQSSPTYLVSFAVGPFTLNDTVYNGLNGQVPVEYYALQPDSSAAATTFADVPEMMALFEEKFGPYHWEKAGYTVVDFNSGAMEHMTNIAYPSYALSNSIGDQTLVAHELSHNWFGNQVTCSDAAHMWLNEGWASYCEALYVEHFYGEQQYRQYVRSNQLSVVNSAHETDNGYWPLSNIPTNITYSTTVYDKGSMIVHNLRHYMGDSLFFLAVQDYISTYSENHASSADLRDQLSASSGLDLTGFFDNYVFQGGFPQYSIDSVIMMGDEVKITVSQQSVGRDFMGDENRVPVGFIDDNWNVHEYWIEFDGLQGSQTFSPGFSPAMVVLDFQNKIAGPVFNDYKTIDNTGFFYPSGMDITIMPQLVADSVFIHAAEMRRRPVEGGDTINNIEVLDWRWWRITYDTKGDFEAKCRVSYNFNNAEYLNLDPGDSIMLVYRADNESQWQYVEQSWNGSIYIGDFLVENLQKGNYAIARWNEESGIDRKKQTKYFKAWPNPSRGGFYIHLPENSHCSIRVFNQQGVLVDEIKETTTEGQLYYPARDLSAGVYFLQLKKDGKTLGKCQIVKSQ